MGRTIPSFELKFAIEKHQGKMFLNLLVVYFRLLSFSCS
jgi:hypothetical protein